MNKDIVVIAHNSNDALTKSMTRPLIMAIKAVAGCTVRWTTNLLYGHEEPAKVRFLMRPVGLLTDYLAEDAIVYTIWEPDMVPPFAVACLNRARAVIAAGEWTAKLLREGGVTVPIHSVNLGIDTSIFYPDDELRQSRTFVIAGTHANPEDPKKGYDAAIAAFQIALRTVPDINLCIKLTKDSIPVNCLAPNVQVICEDYSIQQLANLYRRCCAYINASYCEGWGLCPHEALACGCPVISTYWGGVTGFLKTKPMNFVRVRHRLEKAYGPYRYGNWARPDIYDLADAIVDVATRPRFYNAFGLMAAKTVEHLNMSNYIKQLSKIVAKYV